MSAQHLMVSKAGYERTKKVVEQLAAVFVRVEAVIDIRLQTRVNVAVVEFAVQNQEDGIYWD